MAGSFKSSERRGRTGKSRSQPPESDAISRCLFPSARGLLLLNWTTGDGSTRPSWVPERAQVGVRLWTTNPSHHTPIHTHAAGAGVGVGATRWSSAVPDCFTISDLAAPDSVSFAPNFPVDSHRLLLLCFLLARTGSLSRLTPRRRRMHACMNQQQFVSSSMHARWVGCFGPP